MHGTDTESFSYRLTSVLELTLIPGFSAGYLVVVEVVYEGGETPGLVLLRQCQHRNVADKYGVEEPGHLQVVTGTQGLENNS